MPPEGPTTPRGSLVAAVLAGAWRSSPPPLASTAEELAQAAPLLVASGAGALGWWRVRHSELRTTLAAMALLDAYRLHTVQATLHEREIPEAITLLRSAGVEPILVKGWAIARLYPEPGLRPYGDLDLCCQPGQYAAAAAALERPENPTYQADLHEGFAKLDELSWDELYARSRVATLRGVDVRVLPLEDHLRLLCVHLLRHGAWRPLWLCDVALGLEARPAEFDWDRCLGGNRRVADWVACAIGLAHQLLGVEVDDTPVGARARGLPRWLVPHVLKHWSAPYPSLYPPQSYGAPLIAYIRRRTGLPHALRKVLRKHWADPIQATIALRGPLNDLPRLPFQMAFGARRIAQGLAKQPRLVREWR